jgi:TPR repeat protein
VELYEEAVAAGDPAASATLAMMHRLGRGVPRDAERMIALMQSKRRRRVPFRAIPAGADLSDRGGRAPMMRLERSACRSRSRAIPYLAGAARSGNDDAARELVELYATGAPGLAPNPARQFRWTNFLAEKGDAPAMALIAFFYEQGIGVERDPQRAAAEYVRALETGGVDPARCAVRSVASCRPGTPKRRSPSRPSCRNGGFISVRSTRRSAPARWARRGRWRSSRT